MSASHRQKVDLRSNDIDKDVFGAYQIMADLHLVFDKNVGLISPTGDDMLTQGRDSIMKSVDGDSNSKWVVGRHFVDHASSWRFGLGKSVMQLEICRQIQKHEGGKQLIIAPLGVKQEFKRDIKMITDRPLWFIRKSDDVRDDGFS
jgi:hypothetical protein